MRKIILVVLLLLISIGTVEKTSARSIKLAKDGVCVAMELNHAISILSRLKVKIY